MNRDPDRRQADEPEEEEAHEVARRRSRRFGQVVRLGKVLAIRNPIERPSKKGSCRRRNQLTYVVRRRPYRAQGHQHALAPDTRLDAVPDTAY